MKVVVLIGDIWKLHRFDCGHKINNLTLLENYFKTEQELSEISEK